MIYEYEFESFGRPFSCLGVSATLRCLPYQIIRHKDRSIIEVSIPGVKQENIDIEVKTGVLTVSAKDKDHARCQTFTLPEKTDPSQIRATYENGLLSISVYNKEAPLATKIPIE